MSFASAAQPLEQFRKRGVTFAPRLSIRAPAGELTAEDRERLASLKPALLYLLSAELLMESLTPSEREFFEERAAIRQFEGKLSQSDAELLALADVLQVMVQRSNSTATVQPAARSA